MNNKTRFLLGLFVLAAIFLAPLPGMTQVPTYDVTATPSTASVTAFGDRTVGIRWEANHDGTSERGEYRTPAGDLIGTNDTRVTIPPKSLRASERLVIPVDILGKAVEMGFTEVRYIRIFHIALDIDLKGQDEVLVRIQGAPYEVLADPSRATVGYGTDTVVPVRWTIRLTKGRGRQIWVESEEGNFTDKRGRLLRPPVMGKMRDSGYNEVVFDEDLKVPAAIIRTIGMRGETIFRYTRVFMADGLPLEGMMELKIEGAIQEVTAQPPTARVAAGRSNTVGVTWQAVLRPGASSAGLTIRSREGGFYTPTGRFLGRVSKNLSRTMGTKGTRRSRSKALPGEIIDLKETLTVPRDIIDAGLKAGSSTIVFRRLFFDGFAEKSGDLKLQISGRIGFGFSIERVELRFLDGTRLKTVATGEAAQAVALVTFSGSGRIYGDWSLADATTTLGAPRFVRKAIVNEPLNGRRRKEIRSPFFPSNRSGVQVIRFRILRPDVGPENALTLSYVVRAAPEIPAEVREVDLLSPRSASLIGPGTLFSWEPLGGSAAYQLEFYGVPSVRREAPVTGLVIPGETASVPLTRIAGDHFTPGASYWWRVLALSAGGELLGQSTLSEIRAP